MAGLRSRLVLAILLLFAQQAGLMHLAAHAAERLGREDPTPASEQLCVECALIGLISAPPAALTVAVPLFEPAVVAPDRRLPHVADQLPPAYRSRAPPDSP